MRNNNKSLWALGLGVAALLGVVFGASLASGALAAGQPAPAEYQAGGALSV